MNLENLAAGQHVPDKINVIIEIPSHASPIKYEVDKTTGLISVDRFLMTAMVYPCEYGFIPQTLAEDGDPLDVLVVSPFSLLPGVMICCRPIGLLRMTDESGPDAKILAVPVNKLTLQYANIMKPKDLQADLIDRIEHFFTHYKDLEKGKWAKVDGWEEAVAAENEILAGIARYHEQKVAG